MPEERTLERIDYSNDVHIISNPLHRLIVLVLGLICLGVGIAGLFLPLLPGFPLLLAAGYLFSKSSVRYYNWLMNHRKLGPIIRDYNSGQGLPLRVKVTAISTLWIAVAISTYMFMESIYPRVAFVIIAIGVSYHLLSLPTAGRNDRSDEEPITETLPPPPKENQ